MPELYREASWLTAAASLRLSMQDLQGGHSTPVEQKHIAGWQQQVLMYQANLSTEEQSRDATLLAESHPR